MNFSEDEEIEEVEEVEIIPEDYVANIPVIHKKFILNEFMNKINIFQINVLNSFTPIFIGGIQVDIIILSYDKKKYNLYIISTNVQYQKENKEPFTTDYIFFYKKEDYFYNIFDLLDHVEYIKKNYVFYYNRLVSPTELNKLNRMKKSIVSFKIDECSICYRPTEEYTICKHSICFNCRDNCIIKKINTCPICRQTQLSMYPNELEIVILKKDETKKKCKSKYSNINNDDDLLKIPSIHMNFIINDFINYLSDIEYVKNYIAFLNEYTKIVIDGIEVIVHIDIDKNKLFYFYIYAKHIKYDKDVTYDTNYRKYISKRIYFYKNGPFYNIIDLLNALEIVKNTYVFFNIQLVSPDELINLKNVSLDIDENCSICCKSTNQYALCTHPICLHCREKSIVEKRNTCLICNQSELSIYPHTIL